MAIVQLISLGSAHITDASNFEAADRWDGYVCPTPRDFPEGPFQGYQLDWGFFDSQTPINQFQNQPYAGYSSNWGSSSTQGTIGAFSNKEYVGYSSNWGSFDDQPITVSIKNIDINTLVDHPKDQIIYYKLKGYNELTEEYESWVIAHNITGRPGLDGGLFDPDPGRQPPNVERDVFKTPPSGNTLVNIVIVARWFE